MLQILDGEGQLASSEHGYEGTQLVDLYRPMLTARDFDEYVLQPRNAGRVSAFHQAFVEVPALLLP
jgi:TPP-dependent pyruvate/acetoin dehydrogenase alpha subunit